ncbi:MAG: DNA translocase FtsK 4TM domain-containing protein, partial [Bacteroidales bacterium]|nr:DNA translocase FtsK 4TM domain-containing protein [Bacteroidales bacterium]
MLSFWKNLDDADKARIRVISGCLMAVLTLLTLIACVSYLFTWKVDQSLLSDPQMMSENVSVHNMAGKLGYRWANFLVGRCFGLGSFALIVIMAAVSVRLLFRKEYFPIVKGTLIIVFGAMIASFMLSWAASLAGPDNSFGGGLGGECGSSVVRWSNNLFGPVITFLLLLILLAVWLFFLSRRFTDWLIHIGAEEPRAEA